MREKGIEDIKVAVGGVIPRQDIEKLTALGVDAVFPGGVPFSEIVEKIHEIV
jgi:methylmalonyl-CoA mutase C-terminal domain/subunit